MGRKNASFLAFTVALPLLTVAFFANLKFRYSFVLKWKEHATLQDDKLGYDYQLPRSNDVFVSSERNSNSSAFRAIPHVKPNRIVLLGERNSGTDYISNILRRMFAPTYNNITCKVSPMTPDIVIGFKFATCIPVFGFKHMFRPSPLNAMERTTLRERDDLLWVLAVRNPCDWADGMYRKPHHLCPIDDPSRCPKGPRINIERIHQIGNKTRAEFFTSPWADWMESFFSPNREQVTYRNVFELRRHKLSLMKEVVDAVPHNVKIVHLSTLERDPHGFFQQFTRQFGLKINEGCKKNPMKPSTMHTEPLCLSEEEWKIAQQEIDWDMEGYFGYNQLDCKMCFQHHID